MYKNFSILGMCYVFTGIVSECEEVVGWRWEIFQWESIQGHGGK